MQIFRYVYTRQDYILTKNGFRVPFVVFSSGKLILPTMLEKWFTCAMLQVGRLAAYRPTGGWAMIGIGATFVRVCEVERRLSSVVVNVGPNRFVLGLWQPVVHFGRCVCVLFVCVEDVFERIGLQEVTEAWIGLWREKDEYWEVD